MTMGIKQKDMDKTLTMTLQNPNAQCMALGLDSPPAILKTWPRTKEVPPKLCVCRFFAHLAI